jgi:hypothetical protein
MTYARMPSPGKCRTTSFEPLFSGGLLVVGSALFDVFSSPLRQGEDMSTSRIFKSPSVILRQHDGPLGIHIDAYEALLGEHGYSPRSTYVHLHIVSDLSRWLKRRRLASDQAISSSSS